MALSALLACTVRYYYSMQKHTWVLEILGLVLYFSRSMKLLEEIPEFNSFWYKEKEFRKIDIYIIIYYIIYIYIYLYNILYNIYIFI